MLFTRKTVLLLKQCSKDCYRRNASHVAFIGVGNMGSRMARNLLKKGEALHIYDITPENALSITNAKVCRSPQEAAVGASTIITMLPNSTTVKEAILGPNGVLESAPSNALLIDCSTIEPQVAQDLSKAAISKGLRFIDAPVSGGVTGAEAGTLTFMVGGETATVNAAESILLKLGAKVLHCGAPGAGQIAKLCNNLILGVTMIGTAEGMNLGIKLGLDPKVLADVVNVSTGRSWSSDSYNPVPGLNEGVPASNGYKGGFAVGLMAKDLGLAEKAALSCGAPVPLGAAAHQLYRLLSANEYGLKDFASVYQFIKGKH